MKPPGFDAHLSLRECRTWLSRSGARCRDCSRSVSPGRSPNPGADLSAAGSARCLSLAWLATIQALGILLPRYRYRYRVMGTLAMLNSSIPSTEGLRHRPVWSVRRRWTSAHFRRCRFFHQRMTLHHTKFFEGVHGVFADRVFEVVGPAAHDLVEPDQHDSGWVLRQPARQGTDLVLQRPDGPVGNEGVDVPLVRASLAAPPDAEPEEVERLAHVHDPGLGRGQPKTQRRQHINDFFAQGFDVVAGTVHEYDEIVGLCRLPDYADWSVPDFIDTGLGRQFG
jgi:hypothetical protein